MLREKPVAYLLSFNFTDVGSVIVFDFLFSTQENKKNDKMKNNENFNMIVFPKIILFNVFTVRLNKMFIFDLNLGFVLYLRTN